MTQVQNISLYVTVLSVNDLFQNKSILEIVRMKREYSKKSNKAISGHDNNLGH